MRSVNTTDPRKKLTQSYFINDEKLQKRTLNYWLNIKKNKGGFTARSVTQVCANSMCKADISNNNVK